MVSVQREAGLRRTLKQSCTWGTFFRWDLYSRERVLLVMGFQRRNPHGWSSHFAVDLSFVLKNAHLFPVCG